MKTTHLIFLNFILISSLIFSSFIYANDKPTNSNHPTFNSIVILGDSFSDNGNVYRLTHSMYPGKGAYFQGRFSDGPTWPDYLARQLGLHADDSKQSLNFAYGQAQVTAPYMLAVKQGDKKLNYTIPDLNQQISDYLKNPVQHPDKTLFVVFIGTNDLLNLGDTVEQPSLITQMLDKEMTQIKRLIAHGAQHILIFNMRDLTLSAYVQTAAQDMATHPDISPEQYINKYRELITAYNKELSARLAGNKKIILFDTYAFDDHINRLIHQGGYDYVFENKTYTMKYGEEPCYVNKGNYQDLVSPICKNPAEYFFYDRVHPTTYAHKIMADAVYKKLQ